MPARLLCLTATLAAIGCTDASIYWPEVEKAPPPETMPNRLTGTYCVDAPKLLTFPTRVWFVIDDSGSMKRNDPNRTRYAAVRALSQRLGSPGKMFFGGEWFSDGATRFSNPRFTDDVASFNAQVPDTPGGGDTNYGAALRLTHDELAADIGELGSDARAVRYVIIFLSDGTPNPALSDADAMSLVDNIMSLRAKAGSIVLNTVWLGGAGGAEVLLQRMATRGGGKMKSFPDGDSLDYSGFEFSTVLRTFKQRNFFVTNRSMVPWNAEQRLDSDGDGLPDSVELDQLKTDPAARDTDGDGCGDLLEDRLNWNPRVNAGAGECACSASELKDTDADGLTDCEENWLTTIVTEPDSDIDARNEPQGDLVPDGIDHLYLDDAKFANDGADHDLDGETDMSEMEHHTNPVVHEGAARARLAYRYVFPQQPNQEQCFEFTVENVALGPTLATADHAANENVIELYLAQSPKDNPFVDQFFRVARKVVPHAEGGQVIKIEPGDFSTVLKKL